MTSISQVFWSLLGYPSYAPDACVQIAMLGAEVRQSVQRVKLMGDALRDMNPDFPTSDESCDYQNTCPFHTRTKQGERVIVHISDRLKRHFGGPKDSS